MTYSYILAIILVFAPRCEYVPCSPCHTRQWQAMLLFLLFSFVLPELVMFTSDGGSDRFVSIFNDSVCLRRQERHLFYRIAIQMSMYVVWSCLYYCPPAFYNLTLIMNSNNSSPSTQSAMIIVSTVSVQSYPILTYLLMCNFSSTNEEIPTETTDAPTDCLLDDHWTSGAVISVVSRDILWIDCHERRNNICEVVFLLKREEKRKLLNACQEKNGSNLGIARQAYNLLKFLFLPSSDESVPVIEADLEVKLSVPIEGNQSSWWRLSELLADLLVWNSDTLIIKTSPWLSFEITDCMLITIDRRKTIPT